jgi:hypothetical protein
LLTGRNAPVPLAVELAAARVASLTVSEIAQRLDQRFRLLTGGRRTALERHQTLRGAVEWSYGLLAAAEAVLGRARGRDARGSPPSVAPGTRWRSHQFRNSMLENSSKNSSFPRRRPFPASKPVIGRERSTEKQGTPCCSSIRRKMLAPARHESRKVHRQALRCHSLM